MQCESCNGFIEDGEERNLHGRLLCEDCYLDLVSPIKACDPWAVHSAKSLIKGQKHDVDLTAIQKEILDILREKGAMETSTLAGMLQIKQSDLGRELAVLRHMEKVRGELRQGNRRICLW